MSNYFSEFALFCFAEYNFHIPTLILQIPQILCVRFNIMNYYHKKYLQMISIQKLKFLFLISSFYCSTNYIFLTMLLSFSIPYLHSYSMNFKNILSSSSLLFFPSSSSFSFLFFPHFPFVPFFFSLFSSFFLFPNLHHFLNLVCHFPRAPLPCSRTFCCPGMCPLRSWSFFENIGLNEAIWCTIFHHVKHSTAYLLGHFLL